MTDDMVPRSHREVHHRAERAEQCVMNSPGLQMLPIPEIRN